VLLSFSGAFLAIIFYHFFSQKLSDFKMTEIGANLYTFFNNKWHFDLIYNHYLVKSLLKFGYSVTYKTLDRGLIEWVGPFGIAHQLTHFTKNLSLFQSGQVYNYAFTIFSAATIFIFGLGSWAYLDLRLDLLFGLLILLAIIDFSSHKTTS
jgi:NADH-ubiquinone oxidoreductase chain 5